MSYLHFPRAPRPVERHPRHTPPGWLALLAAGFFSIVSCLFTSRPAHAQAASGITYQTLYSFRTKTSDGLAPVAGLTLGTDGNFYGTTSGGGANENSYGTVFKITPSGTETVLYSFGVNSADGQDPAAGLTLGTDGNFYGTTAGGGANVDSYGDGGTVFKITPSGTEIVLYSFGAYATDALSPRANLTLGTDGNFYGTTDNGGSNYNYGTVFKITPSGTEAVLYSFGANSSDGTYPEANLTLGTDGNFYGTTRGGGGANGDYGTVFKLAVSMPGFTLSVNPSQLTISPGGTASATVTVTPQNGFTGTVNVTASGVGGGADYFSNINFNPNPITLNGSSATTTITWTAVSSLTAGETFPCTIQAASGSTTASAPLISPLPRRLLRLPSRPASTSSRRRTATNISPSTGCSATPARGSRSGRRRVTRTRS